MPGRWYCRSMTTEAAAAVPFRSANEPWVAFRDTLDAMLEPLGDLLLARLHPELGQRVLDVGCGCGTTTLSLGDRVGAEGSVVGVDTSEAMLAVAEADARSIGPANVEYLLADAGRHRFVPNSFDVVHSRLGTMFFDEPEAAFANLRRALRPGGTLGMVCWRRQDENRWTTEPLEAASVILPGAETGSGDPSGPFSLSSSERISDLLSQAGFVDVVIEPHDESLLIGRGDVDEGIYFFLRLLPTGYLTVEPDRHALDRIRATLREVLERHRTDVGIWMGSATWVVTAH